MTITTGQQAQTQHQPWCDAHNDELEPDACSTDMDPSSGIFVWLQEGHDGAAIFVCDDRTVQVRASTSR